MSRRKDNVERSIIPLSFLLQCSETELGSFELARLSAVANLRVDLHRILDGIIDEMSKAALAAWFRQTDRDALKRALTASPEERAAEVLSWAKSRIREGQRSGEELLPVPSLPPGAAHLAAALRYQQRNIAEGKCRYCPKPLDRNSVDMCTDHLAKARARSGPKGKPGSTDYLYGDGFQDRHGRQPGTLASLEMNREKKTRAVLAELGIPPESAAVSLKAAKDALLKCMPDFKVSVLTQAELFEKAGVVTKTTGQRALNELLAEGKIQRIGKGTKSDLFRYFQKRGKP